MKPTVPPEPERWQRFNDTTGAISWNRRSANLHPDRCVCQELERGQNAGTPHKHYDDPPHACARCSECDAYRPAVPAAVPPEPAPPTARPEEFRCDWKSWCVRIEGHGYDCEPATPSRLYEPSSPLDSALVLAVHCARCRASASVRCVGSINEPVTFHYARFVLANVAPKDEPEAAPAAPPTVAPALDKAQLVRDLASAIHMVDDELIHGPGDPPHPRAAEIRAYRSRLQQHMDGLCEVATPEDVETLVASMAPTVAPARPAREVAHEQAQAPSLRFPCQGGEVDHDGMTYAHTATCDHWTEAIERDRASRSPGHREALERIAAEECCWVGSYADCDEAAANPNEDFEGPCPRCIAVAALRGGGPSPAREVGKVQGAPLSGLDAATAVRAVDCPACGAASGDACDSWNDGEVQVAYCGRRISRALATPPGQAKP